MKPLQVSLRQARTASEKLEQFRKMKTPILAKLLERAMKQEGSDPNLSSKLLTELNEHLDDARQIVDGVLEILEKLEDKKFDIRIEL